MGVDPQMTIEFKCKENSLKVTAANIRSHSIFSTPAPVIPSSSRPGLGWRGITYMDGTSICAKIENDLSEYTMSNLLQYAHDTVHIGVHSVEQGSSSFSLVKCCEYSHIVSDDNKRTRKQKAPCTGWPRRYFGASRATAEVSKIHFGQAQDRL